MSLVPRSDYEAGQQFVKLLLEDRYLLRLLVLHRKEFAFVRLGAAVSRIFWSQQQDVQLLRIVLPLAVDSTASAELLFREDGVYTEISSEFMRVHSYLYLKRALRDPLKKIIKEDLDLEGPDGAKIGNVSKLMQYSELILLSLVDNVKHVSSPMREAIIALSDAAETKWNASCRQPAISAIFFLRLVCPAIIDPVKYLIVKALPREARARKTFLQISKAIKSCVDTSDFLLGDPAVTTFQQKSRKPLERLFLELRRPPSPASEKKPSSSSSNSSYGGLAPTMDAAIAPALAVIRTINDSINIVEDHLSAQPNGEATLRSLQNILNQLNAEKISGRESPKRRSEKSNVMNVIREKEKEKDGNSAGGRLTVAMENWSREKVIQFLELIDLSHLKTIFTEKQVSGRLLVQLDPKGLLLLGVTNESDQWRILQARHDILTLEKRFVSASATPSYDNGVKLFPPLLDNDVSKLSKSTTSSTFSDTKNTLSRASGPGTLKRHSFTKNRKNEDEASNSLQSLSEMTSAVTTTATSSYSDDREWDDSTAIHYLLSSSKGLPRNIAAAPLLACTPSSPTAAARRESLLTSSATIVVSSNSNSPTPASASSNNV